MKEIFDEFSIKTSRTLTLLYSTSFSLGIRFISKKYRESVYAIYGFVRLGDEIVDSFHNFDKYDLFERYKEDVYRSISEGISLNPVLNSFQAAVNRYGIDHELIDLFLKSMEMDLNRNQYDENDYKEYILGSAEVVGLMCLKVFCDGDNGRYEALKRHAMSLGSAYQKINFLRDMNADFYTLGRVYFPNLTISSFNDIQKKQLERDIEYDFREGFKGIKRLPSGARFGVYLSFVYYYNLFIKIRNTPCKVILKERVRISNRRKYYLLGKSIIKYKLDLI